MKSVYFMRHAKSSWDDLKLKDHDRPLNERGVKDAMRMAHQLKSMNVDIDIIISSTALRAKSTAESFKGELDTYNLIAEPNLYHSTPKDMMRVLNNIHDEVNSAMLVAHNPGMTDMINLFSKELIYNVPTAGIFKVIFNSDKWENIDFRIGTLDFFIYPKSFNHEN